MIRASVTGRTEGNLSRARFRKCNELLRRLHRHSRVRGQEILSRVELSDASEILDRIIGQLAQARIDDKFRRDRHERVTVRRRLRDELGADHCSGARPIVHDDRDAQLLGQALGYEPRHSVGAASGRYRHDHAYRLRGVVLRVRQGHQESACPCQ
jgi:hypothetical protein